MPQSFDFSDDNIEMLEHQLGRLLVERNAIAQKMQAVEDEESRVWYSARLKLIDDQIHKTRNALFIELNFRG